MQPFLKPKCAEFLLPVGLLVYNGELTNGNGDFMGVAMRDGRVEFKFDVGSGPATIMSDPIPLNEWHTIRVKRTNRDGRLGLNLSEFTISPGFVV